MPLRVDPIRDVILSEDNAVYISVAFWWELAIKISLGKLDAELPELRSAAQESYFLS